MITGIQYLVSYTSNEFQELMHVLKNVYYETSLQVKIGSSPRSIYRKMESSIIWRIAFHGSISICVIKSLICSCFGAKIAEGMLPPTALLRVLNLLSKVMPKAKLFPHKDLSALTFREPGKRKVVGNFVNP